MLSSETRPSCFPCFPDAVSPRTMCGNCIRNFPYSMALHRCVWRSRRRFDEHGHFDSAATQYRIYRLMYNKSSPHYRQIWTSGASPIVFTPNIFNLPFIHQIIWGDVRCYIDRHRFDCEHCRSIYKLMPSAFCQQSNRSIDEHIQVTILRIFSVNESA